MKQQTLEIKISGLLAQLVTEVKGSSALGLTDINKLCEDSLLPVLKNALDLPNLRNLNQASKKNFPAIDLADDESETAIQVTATSERSKITDTLKKFAAHGLNTRYRRLLVYVLTEKKEHYATLDASEYTGANIEFDINRDVIDYRDVLKALHGKPIEILETIARALENQMSTMTWGTPEETSLCHKENVFLNLLSISFPSELYVGELRFDVEERPPRHERSRINSRDKVRELLDLHEVRFSSDWTCHENQLVTFHDLSDDQLPLSKIVEKGTVTCLNPKEYYGADENQERVFKSLLHNCLKQDLFRKGVQWQHEADLFIFVPEHDDQMKREVSWNSGKVSRTVYQRKMNKKDPTKVFQCKHLAFDRQFLYLDGGWFLVIKPDWFMSRDGYNESQFGHDSISWLKRHEWNKTVFTHLRFLIDFLTTEPGVDLFNQDHSSKPSFLKFDQLVTFRNVQGIPDNDWIAEESQDRKARIQSEQIEFPI